MPGHPHHDRLATDLPAQVAQRQLALAGEHHVAVPLPGVRRVDLRERPVVEVAQRVHRPLVDGEVLRAGPGDVEGVGAHGQPVRRAGQAGGLDRHLGRAVRRAVVDQQDRVGAAQQGRQHERQVGGLVLDPQHRRRAPAQPPLRPALPRPVDVEVGVPLEVAQRHRCWPRTRRTPRRRLGGIAARRPCGSRSASRGSAGAAAAPIDRAPGNAAAGAGGRRDDRRATDRLGLGVEVDVRRRQLVEGLAPRRRCRRRARRARRARSRCAR